MEEQSNFIFVNGDTAAIVGTHLHGIVLGRADYRDSTQNHYLLRHIDGQGNPVEIWFAQDQLAPK
jgi:hypothetical protein